MINHNCSAKKVLVSLIDSIDMYSFLLQNHHRRTAFIAYQLGKIYGLSRPSLSDLVLAASLHDIGTLNVEERNNLFYIDAVNPGEHELMGSQMLEAYKALTPIRKIIRHHHIKASDIKENLVKEKDVPFECYFLHLADRIDILMNSNQQPYSKQMVIYEIQKRFGEVFLPELKDPFEKLMIDNNFNFNIDSIAFQKLVTDAVDTGTCKIEDDEIEEVAGVFATIIDYRSKWTRNHSISVGHLAYMIATYHGLKKETCRMLKIAGFLHDIGKIAISTEPFEKMDYLDWQDQKIIKSHSVYSSRILCKTPSLSNICKWVSAHHERRDQTGYPLQLNNIFFSIETDILAYADIFATLSEDRPHRKAMSKGRIIIELERLSHEKLSPVVFKTINDNYDLLYRENSNFQNVPLYT